MSAPADFLRYWGGCAIFDAPILLFCYNAGIVSGDGRRLHSHHLHLLELAPSTISGRNYKKREIKRLFDSRKKILMTIQENVPLAPFTTFRLGGAARFFVHAESVDDVKEALAFADKKKAIGVDCPVFVLGGGSNLLISDDGFAGLVIKNELNGIVEEEVVGGFVRVIAGAGESWDNLVEFAVVKKGLYGLENLSLIPGTVGAAPVQNIGAYGTEAKNTIDWVEVYNPAIGVAAGTIERLSSANCHFGYRDSIFKHAKKK